MKCQARLVATITTSTQSIILVRGRDFIEEPQTDLQEYALDVRHLHLEKDNTILALLNKGIEKRRRARRSGSGVWRCSGQILETPHNGPTNLLYLVALLRRLTREGCGNIEVRVPHSMAWMTALIGRESPQPILSHIMAKICPDLKLTCAIDEEQI